MIIFAALVTTLGFAVLLASLIGLIKPVPQLLIPTRKRAVAAFLFAHLLMVFGIVSGPSFDAEASADRESLRAQLASLEARLESLETINLEPIPEAVPSPRSPQPVTGRSAVERRQELPDFRLIEASGACSEAIDSRLERRGYERAWTAMGTDRFPEIGEPRERDFSYMGHGTYTVRTLSGNALRVDRGGGIGVQQWCYDCDIDTESGDTIPNFLSPSGMEAGDKLLRLGPC